MEKIQTNCIQLNKGREISPAIFALFKEAINEYRYEKEMRNSKHVSAR